jgi:opine dehydrogenase
MSNGFSEFADAMAQPRKAVPVASRTYANVAVLGGGDDARLLAALCLAQGASVTLFSAYGSELTAMRTAGAVALRGEGPVGSYQFDSNSVPSIRTTAELDAAVVGADLIFLTGPVHKQRTYAMVLADHLSDGQVVALAPARTFGALECRWLLQIGGCAADVSFIELCGLPFWTEASGSTLNLSAVGPLAAAALPGGRTDTIVGLEQFFPGIGGSASSVHLAFADASGIAETVALLLGGPGMPSGGPAIPMGGTSLPGNETFRNLMGERHLKVFADMAAERRLVAQSFGVRDLPDGTAWLDRFAGKASGAGSRPVPTADATSAIVRDAVVGSLCPLVSAARMISAPTPVTDAMIGLASSVLGADLSTAGRTLGAMGVSAADADSARRQLMQMAGLG